MKTQISQQLGEFKHLLTPTEKMLIKKLQRLAIRGKCRRAVSVLFDKHIQLCVEVTIEVRQPSFAIHNMYLFGLSGTANSISGYHIFRKHVERALGDARMVSSLTSTKLHYLAAFMGHTLKAPPAVRYLSNGKSV